MNGQNLIRGGTAFVQDVLAGLSLPGSAVFGLAVANALERRKQEAIGVLIDEIKKEGIQNIKFSNNDADEFVQMLLRFSSAVDAGAVRQNLRLLAQVIVGLKRHKTFEFKFDRFSKWANVLQSLTRNEILFLGACYKNVSDRDPNEFWKNISASLSNTFTPLEISELAAALTRTGLLLPIAAWGGQTYKPSPSLEELGQLAEIELASLDR
ncbi:hypothetical protein [Methylocapsa acidiphila]|uniref:hypothetical protein n=1 Tax=Methylocapsa acidiphila TaxID=133552 RepID=UPI0012EC443E|nr:hypothetical protein [Methylocapsa acidiphila]